MIEPQSAYNGNGQGQNDLFLSVVNSVATNITTTAARLNGEVTDTGGEAPTN